MKRVSLTTNECFFKRYMVSTHTYIPLWLIDAHVQLGLKLHVSGFPFFPLWRVQPEPLSLSLSLSLTYTHTHTHTPNTWVLPVNAGSLLNGKWYMTGRLCTEARTHTHAGTRTHSHTSICARHIYSVTHILSFTPTCDKWAQGHIHFVPPRIQMAHKSNERLDVWTHRTHLSCRTCFIVKRRPETSPPLLTLIPGEGISASTCP